jgi:hypothetical protein
MRRAFAGSLVLLLACASVVAAQDTSALINEALDKPIKMDINATLPQAMNTIGEQTGVRLEATQSVWDVLPWGQGTTINAKIENQTLRQALHAITQKLGLTFVLRDEAVQLRPMPALQRLAKRATVQELQALDLLSANPLGLGTDRPTVSGLLSAVDQRLQDLKSPFAIENRAGDVVKADQVVTVPRNATLVEALEALASQTPATWYPWGKSIVVVSKEDQVRNQLGKTLTVRYNGTELSQVLMELSKRSGVPFEVQPGAIAQVSPEFRSVRLFLDDASIKQALDAISGFTGLSYTVNEKGVYIWNNAGLAATGQNGGGAPRDPVVGIIQLDNGMQILIPQSQVPEDMREYLKARTQRELKKIRQMMTEEGFKAPPATQPAPAAPTTTTRPTGNEDL